MEQPTNPAITDRPLLYVLDGHTPVAADLNDLSGWAALMEDREARRVTLTHLATATVSTVFLGIDHNVEGQHALFETMVFGGLHDQLQWRYPTWELAEQGHARVVAQIEGAQHD